MTSWTGSEDCFPASDECLKPMQNVPSIESAGDSDSDDEEEDLFFSGLNNNNEEVRLCNTLESPKHSTEANVQSYNSTAVTDTPGTNLSRRSSAETHISTSWSSLSQSHQADRHQAKPQNQPPTGHQQLQVAQTAVMADTNTVEEDDCLSSTAGWFTGAAGQLAASRGSNASVFELADSSGRQHEHAGRKHEHTGAETEEEVEQAFQHAVQGASDPAPTSASVQLTAAVHDMDIDHLLQKLICGEIEYNPHDPNSGLPPASSLFTDSEASSEAEEDRAALDSPVQMRRDVLNHRMGQSAGISTNKVSLQRHDITEFKQPKLVAAPSSDNQGLHQQPTAEAHQKQSDSQTKNAKGTYIRHRQTSRLSNRFQQHSLCFDAENGVAEEFDEWRISRAQLKQKSRC